ncbi:MAG: hypothetical protein H6Q55_3572 [Deltaproteobacteria bacterium]|nr:hypothetical protein [Deltaproteobacteria bacterium]
MKTRITLAMACFIGFILCSAAVAYYPALIVRECPHCKAHVVQEDTLTGNTIGAKYYTDGKREAKMLPDHPALVKCPVCGGLFWVEEAPEVGMGFDAAEGKQKVLAPSEKELIPYLASETLPKEKEFYLRLRLWWMANDAWRHVPNSKPAFSPEQVENLIALSALFDESLPGHRILKAEIARELGRFDECLLLLSSPFDEDYGFVVGFIKKLAEEKVRAVKLFEPGK